MPDKPDIDIDNDNDNYDNDDKTAITAHCC